MSRARHTAALTDRDSILIGQFENSTTDPVFDETLLTAERAINPVLYDWMLASVDEAGYRFSGVQQGEGIHARDLLLTVARAVQGVGAAVVAPATIAGGYSGARLARRQLVDAGAGAPCAHLSAEAEQA